jgi:hypothetical protein
MRPAVLRMIALATLVGVAGAGCRCSCTYRPDGASEEQSLDDLLADSPECLEVRSKHEACLSGIFDPKWSCGPKAGECIASARARLKCTLAIKGNYDCHKDGDSKSMSPSTPSDCMEFKKLCTGVDRETKVIAAASSEP